MEFVKLPKSDFPELMQDEMQELLNVFSEVSGLESFKPTLGGGASCHAVSTNLYRLVKSLFHDGNVYKVTKIEDLLKFCSNGSSSFDEEPAHYFMESIVCPMEDLPKYIGRVYAGHFRTPTSSSVIARWRMSIGT